MLRPLAAATSLGLAFALALAAVPAAACSPGPDFRVPTNLELAGHADAIVVARVMGTHGTRRASRPRWSSARSPR